MLEELALRRGARAKMRYWKSFRLAQFWLGDETARRIVQRLAEGGYIKTEGEYVVLMKRFAPQKSLRAVLRDVYTLVSTGMRR